jgi:UDP-N-acetylmuramyl pentapeptide phosphotransferase/UDP-N-acetylglucosamine-1-phosphate transferase
MTTAVPTIAVLAPVIAFVVAAALTQALARAPRLLPGMVDEPNERSLHRGAIPRSGGVAVLSATALGWALVWPSVPVGAQQGWAIAAALPVAAVSLLDDLGGVRPRYRLAAHALGAALLLAGGGLWLPVELPGMAVAPAPPLAFLLTLLFVVWMINLYNFMDGMDGFASGMTLFGFGALAVIAWRAGDLGFALLSGVIAAAGGGFLTANFPPARIFLGDLGSATLGLLAAAVSLMGAARGLFPLWVAWLAFSPFIVDATWTLLRRLCRREPVWQAHRSHHYQRLVLAGWSHRRTVLRAYLLMAACAATAVAAPGMTVPEQQMLLVAWAVIYGLIGYRTRLAERRAGIDPP